MSRRPQALPEAGFAVVRLDTVDSTNAYALDHAGGAVADRCWVIATQQSGGRGRHGRSWVSPPGNLYATLLLIEACPVAVSPQLGFVAGLAVSDAVRSLAPGVETCLKWPNDLLGRANSGAPWSKLSGILLEGRMLENGRQAVAVGIGVNIMHAPTLPDRPAISLAALGAPVEREAMFEALCRTFAARLRQFARGDGFASIRAAWLQGATAWGTAMNVKLPAHEHHGRFAGIDATGRLALDTGSGMVHVDAGDVFLTSGS